MQFLIEVQDKKNVAQIVSALLILGCADIQIVDNTHLESGNWEIVFINYNLKKLK